MRRITVILFFLLISIVSQNADVKGQKTTLRPELLDQWSQLNLIGDSLWFYKSGDNVTWAEPEISYDGWNPVTLLFPKGQTPTDWNGIGWFRAKLNIDSTLFGREMAIHGNLHGAMQLYVNGDMVGSAGHIGRNAIEEQGANYIGPVKFNFSHSKQQTIAIRYSNYSARKYWNRSGSGLVLMISYPQKILDVSQGRVERMQKAENRYFMIFGMIVALALLHLILFTYYPSEKANLICSLFFFAIAGIFLSMLIFPPGHSPEQNIKQIYFEYISMIASAIILPFFIYTIIQRKIDWLPISMLFIGIITLGITLTNPFLCGEYNYIFFHLSTTIGICLILYARFKQKKKELNILLAFYLICFLLLFPFLVETIFDNKFLWSGEVMYMNFSAIPAALGYSFYLARGVAITNRNLGEKLIENEILSADKLRVEIEKQQLIEQQNIQLEKKVTDRTLELSNSLQTLKATQNQLIQQEKLASLGELTAGIAHEIQNPLNFVNNFSEINKELVDELQEELNAGRVEDAIAISKDIKANAEKINHHGKRADAIVKGMLQHSRSGSGEKEPTDINALADEYLRLAYHGLRTKDKSFNAKLETNFDNTIGSIDVVKQDIGRVILNLITNAFWAVDEKKKTAGNTYEPRVAVSIQKSDHHVIISVSDNGNGIPKEIADKIFQPFFTTKPTGQGTGLGLSLSYDIMKAHGGEMKVESNEGNGTIFSILLPPC